MSPIRHRISDYQSENQVPTRGRPGSDLAQLLEAADHLFTHSPSPRGVTMDALAASAGVGKGTLFRAFGSRDGLLDALWARKLAPLRRAFDDHVEPFGTQKSVEAILIALLDSILTVKLDSRHIFRARETAPNLLKSPHYLWMHSVVRELLRGPPANMHDAEATYHAHSLLAALHVDLIEDMLDAGVSLETIRQGQAHRIRAILTARDQV